MATDLHGEAQDGGAYESVTAAEGWRRGTASRTQAAGHVTERMLELAGVAPGGSVLDVAAGTGEQTLLAAQRVGPTGSVLAIDIAPQMLAVAEEAIRQAGLSNVQTRVMDARSLDLEPRSFDAAIARLALMLIPERHKALVGVHRALKPGRKLAAIVIASGDRNPLISIPMNTARRLAGLPGLEREDPGLFALGDPNLLQHVFEQAGYREVEVQRMPFERRFSSMTAAMESRRDSPELSAVMAKLSEAERAVAWTEIEATLQQFAGPEGVTVPGEYLIGAGTT